MKHDWASVVRTAFDPVRNLRQLVHRAKPPSPQGGASSATGRHGLLANLDFLDGIRALSHLWIVVHHVHYLMGITVADSGQLAKVSGTSWVMWLFGLQGPFSVNIMLILSGFLGFRSVLALPEARNGRLEALSLRTVLKFYWNRFLRLAPLYYVMAFIYWLNMDVEVFMHPWGLLYSALFVSNYVPAEDALYLISWSICVDFHLYLTLPLIYEGYRRLVKRFRVDRECDTGQQPLQQRAGDEGQQHRRRRETSDTKPEGGSQVILLQRRGWQLLFIALALAVLLSVAMRAHFIYPFYADEVRRAADTAAPAQRQGDTALSSVTETAAVTLGSTPTNFTLPYRAYLYNMVKNDEVIQLINDMSFFSSEYRYTHLRYTPFVCGIFLAIVFAHRSPASTAGRPRGLLYLLAVLGMVGILLPNASGGEPGSWTPQGTYVYLVFHHIIFSICFTYVLYTDLFLLSNPAAAAGRRQEEEQPLLRRLWHGYLVRLRSMLEWRGWCIIARLSYANYITHFATIIVEYRAMSLLTEMNDTLYIILALVNIPLTLTIALVFHLLIEKPISNLAYYYFKARTPKRQD